MEPMTNDLSKCLIVWNLVWQMIWQTVLSSVGAYKIENSTWKRNSNQSTWSWSEFSQETILYHPRHESFTQYFILVPVWHRVSWNQRNLFIPTILPPSATAFGCPQCPKCLRRRNWSKSTAALWNFVFQYGRYTKCNLIFLG